MRTTAEQRYWLESGARSYLTMGACVLAGVFAVATMMHLVWARDMNAARVTFLGSGDGLSALVTAGSARVLIISGSDSRDLANAFADATHPGMRRVDVVLLDSTEPGGGAVQSVAALSDGAYVAWIGEPDNAQNRLKHDEIIRRQRLVVLPDDVTIRVRVTTRPAEPEDDWCISIARGSETIALLSSPDAELGCGRGASAVAYLSGAPDPTTAAQASKLMIGSSSSFNGRSNGFDTTGPAAPITVQVRDSSILSIELETDGIAFDASHTRSLEPAE